jgi:DNA invertase Pin-like site-specific DNA recombinase
VTAERIPVVALGVRSQDEEEGKDSAGDQMRIAREAALAEPGRFLYSEHADHGSGFRGNRGEKTQTALDDATRAAAEYGRAELWVFKSERLARGSGRRDEARSVLEVYVEMRRAGVDLRSVEDDAYFTNPMLVGVADAMAHKYSEDLSAHVRRGLAERKAAGKPVGAVPMGYSAQTDIVNAPRVADPAGRPIVDRIFDLIEAGRTPGQVSKLLNAEGARTVRGGPWTTRAVRRVVTNVDYCGTTGYPQLIEPERWQRINDGLQRLDPAAVQARKGGRPAGDAYLLAGLAFCRRCGAPMRSKTYRTGTRTYRCRNGMEGINLCNARPVRADVVEQHVLEHLHWFVGSVEDWLAEKVQERSDEQRRREDLLDRERAALDDLDRSRERHLAQYRDLVDNGSHVAYLALEEVERVDREREAQRQAITEAEAVISEWTGAPDTDAALDYYNAIVGVIEGKVRAAKGVKELNAALASVIAGVWLSVEDGTLHAEFQLRPLADDPTGPNALAQILSQDLAGRRMTLPSATLVDEIEMVRASLRGAELDHTPWCTSSRATRRSPRTRGPAP